jgi:hypothetical protein
MATRIRSAKAGKVTRTSPKQVLAEYKQRVMNYIYALKNPGQQLAFSVTGYRTEGGVKKPNTISVPETLAIVGTAAKLGKLVVLRTSGVEDGGQINFYFVDTPASTPIDLL